MANLGVKNEKARNKKKHESLSTIKALPNDLLVEIFAKVASVSIFDLCKVKISCKEFLDAAEDDYVYQHASMENFALVPLPWFTHEKESSFLKRCRESGNSEISYREGMVEYFSPLRVESGLANLKKAALEGHYDAKYIYCMLLMCSEDEQQRKLGFDLFRFLKTSTCFRRCRKRVKSFIRSMWVNNPMVRKSQESLCHSSTCDSSGRLHKLSTRWIEDEDDERRKRTNQDDRKNTFGYAFLYGSTAFSWSSAVVALLTCEAEYVPTACNLMLQPNIQLEMGFDMPMHN